MATEQDDDNAYQVVFEGHLRDGCDPADVRKAVARAMKLSEQRAQRLFSGRRVVIARDLDRARAFRLVARFAALGAVIHVEPNAPVASGSSVRSRLRLPWLVAAAALLTLGVLGGVGLGVFTTGLVERPTTRVDDATTADPARPAMRPPPSAEPSLDSPSVAQRDLPPALRTLSATVQQEYLLRYLPGADHKAFAIAESGAFGWHQGAADENDARAVALDKCLRARRPGDGECRIVDANGAWED